MVLLPQVFENRLLFLKLVFSLTALNRCSANTALLASHSVMVPKPGTWFAKFNSKFGIAANHHYEPMAGELHFQRPMFATGIPEPSPTTYWSCGKSWDLELAALTSVLIMLDSYRTCNLLKFVLYLILCVEGPNSALAPFHEDSDPGCLGLLGSGIPSPSSLDSQTGAVLCLKVVLRWVYTSVKKGL